MSDPTPYDQLSPDELLSAVEAEGWLCDGSLLALWEAGEPHEDGPRRRVHPGEPATPPSPDPEPCPSSSSSPASPPSWVTHNTFRQNLPETDVFAAPDVVVEYVGADGAGCPSTLDVRLRVCNQGDLRIGAQLPVAMRDAAGAIVCTTETTRTLSSGACEELACTVNNPPVAPASETYLLCVDDDGTTPGTTCDPVGTANECREDNNEDDTGAVQCMSFG